MILERLERSFGHPEVVDFQEVELQIEHVMPQTLSPEWREHLESLGQDPDRVHDELVHTLGNLTLTAFNGTLSNNPFERKQQIYGASHLELNQSLSENQAWGERRSLLGPTLSRSRSRTCGRRRSRASRPKPKGLIGAGSRRASTPYPPGGGQATATLPSSGARVLSPLAGTLLLYRPAPTHIGSSRSMERSARTSRGPIRATPAR